MCKKNTGCCAGVFLCNSNENGIKISMKKNILSFSVVISLTSILGCTGTSWINKDNSVASKSKIESAKKTCDVDNKIYNWLDQSTQRSLLISMQKTSQEKKKMKKYFDDQKNKLDESISECMEKEGLIKK